MIAKHQRKDILWAVYQPNNSESFQVQPILIEERTEYGNSIEFIWNTANLSEEFTEVYDKNYAIFDKTKAELDNYEYYGLYWFGTEYDAKEFMKEIIKRRIRLATQTILTAQKSIDELKKSWCYNE